MWENKYKYILSKTYIDDFKNIEINPKGLNKEGFCAAKSILRLLISNRYIEVCNLCKKYPKIIDTFKYLSLDRNLNSTSVKYIYNHFKTNNILKINQPYPQFALNDLKRINEKYYRNKIENYSYFMNDYYHIISSSAYRRMQDKTQLFLYTEEDYSRTRLTHSAEVEALIGKIIAASNIQKYIQKNIRFKEKYFYDLSDAIFVGMSSAALHDIGNPPFGHLSERLITNFFKRKTIKKELRKNKITLKEYKDIINFDGNAQSLRIASKLLSFYNKDGAALTAGVLASIIKYPFNNPKKGKLGYFLTEKDIIEDLMYLGVYIANFRNPFASILEFADDLAYLVSDLEDSIHKNIISIEDFNNVFFSKKKTKDCYVNNFAKRFKSFYKANSNKHPKDLTQINFERSFKPLIFQFREDVIRNFSEIKLKNGLHITEYIVKKGVRYNFQIVDYLKYKELISKLKQLKEKAFKSNEIIIKEKQAKNIFDLLLSTFFEAIINSEISNNSKLINNKNVNNYKFKNKILKYISPNLMENCVKEIKTNQFSVVYCKMRLLIDYISGMTDSYAWKIFHLIAKF